MRRITLREQEEWLERRRAEMGIGDSDYVARNSGKRRSQSKRTLLGRLAEIAKETGRVPPFQARR